MFLHLLAVSRAGAHSCLFDRCTEAKNADRSGLSQSFNSCHRRRIVVYQRKFITDVFFSKKIRVYRHIVHEQLLFRCISGIYGQWLVPVVSVCNWNLRTMGGFCVCYGQWVVSAVSLRCMRTFSVGISRGISFRILLFPTAASDSLTLTSGGKFPGLSVDSAGTRLLPQSSSTYFPTSLFCSAPEHHNYAQTATSGCC